MLKAIVIVVLFCFPFTSALAIKISTENTGQLLLAPVYYSVKNVETKLTIINTRVDAAIVAKLVLRDHKESRKLLEFNLFLSPGDVWTGYLHGGADEMNVFSSDDSVQTDNDVFATPNQPFEHQLINTNSVTNNIGHIEVIGMGSFQSEHRYCASNGKLNPRNGETQCKTVTVTQGMSKNDLIKLARYAASVNSLKADNHGNLIYRDIDSNGGGISTVQPEKLQMTGLAEVIFNSGSRFSYNMIALEPSHYQWGNVGIDIHTGIPKQNGACSNSSNHSCFPNYVISNPLFTSAPLGIGDRFGTSNDSHSFVGDTSDHVVAIEALFAKTDIKHSYSKNKTFLVTTFPTKYRHLSDTGPGVCSKFYGTLDYDSRNIGDSLYTSPFFWDDKGSLYYEFTSFDHQENSVHIPGPYIPEPPASSVSGGLAPEMPTVPPNNQTIEPELWITSLDKHYAFNDGWAALTFLYKGGCGYEGVPSISYTVKIENNNYLLKETF